MSGSILRNIAIAISAGALSVAPALVTGASGLPFVVGTAAFAAGNGGGHGGGHGGGNGGGHGHGGGNGHAGGAGGKHGNSGDHGPAGGAVSIGGFVSGLLGVGHGKASHGHSFASRGSKGLAHRQQAALRGKTVPVPTEAVAVMDKNLHAKLGWLNSLQRNYHAYLNAKDPRFAPIQAYVLGQAQARIDEANARQSLSTAIATYSALSVHHDDQTIDPKDPQAVADRLSELQAVDTSGLTQSELDAYNAEVSALTAIDRADARIADAKATLDDPAAPPEDQAGLVNALETATNSTTVDPDVLGWSSGVLSGKINDVEAALQSRSTEDATDTATVSSVNGSE